MTIAIYLLIMVVVIVDNEKILDKLTLSKEEALTNELIGAYQLALKETRGKIAMVYEKYSVDGVLDIVAMKKNARLPALIASIADELKTLYAKSGKLMPENLSEIYKLNYYYTGFAIEGMAGVNLNYALISPAVVEAAIQMPIGGLTLNKRLQQHRNEIILNTRQQITQGIIQGESIDKMGRRIKGLYDGDASKAVLIARTETNRARNTGKQESYNTASDLGVKFKKVWVATLDDRTRDEHAELDGQYANEDGIFEVAGYSAEFPGDFGDPEMDCNCRCTTRTEFEGLEPSLRKDNETKDYIPYQKYNEWMKARD
jgi:SPP1 gp7 family putative phage head morphogenesis protein